MASNPCVRCVKSIGTFTCRGCGNDFCMNHANEHRQLLLNQMDENIVPLHDQLHEKILEKLNDLNDHPLIHQIEIWERNSIEIIHRTANQLRKDLLSFIEKPINRIKIQLDYLTEEFKKARNNDQFFENDLNQWINKLNHLSTQLETKLNIDLIPTNSLITNVRIDYLNDRFDQRIGNLNLNENGSIVVHNDTHTYASVRGLNDYYQGEHILHFQILNLKSNWIFVGIVSKDSLIPDYPSVGKSAYGWSGLNQVWFDGIGKNKFQNYQSDFQVNDRIDLILNCDQKFISFINQRNRLIYRLNIDINSCPLPWKFSLGFFHSPGESIEILQ